MSAVAWIVVALVAWLAVIFGVVAIVAWRAGRGRDALREGYEPPTREDADRIRRSAR